LVHKDGIGVHAVDLHRDVGRPGPAEVCERYARVEEQCASRSLTGLRELLGGQYADGEAGVDELRVELIYRALVALDDDLGDADLVGVRRAIVDRGESSAVEEIPCVHGVATLP
jgi:hypothetical protein